MKQQKVTYGIPQALLRCYQWDVSMGRLTLEEAGSQLREWYETRKKMHSDLMGGGEGTMNIHCDNFTTFMDVCYDLLKRGAMFTANAETLS